MIGYLDIETSFAGDVTVVGLWRRDRGLVQLVGEGVTAEAFEGLLGGLGTLCTYHGESFDLPVLRRAFGTDLLAAYRSMDIGLECRGRRIRGGLKGAERHFGIGRPSDGLTGYDAMVLWARWQDGDRDALETLLSYNLDDVVNLATLERRLSGDLGEWDVPAAEVVGA